MYLSWQLPVDQCSFTRKTPLLWSWGFKIGFLKKNVEENDGQIIKDGPLWKKNKHQMSFLQVHVLLMQCRSSFTHWCLTRVWTASPWLLLLLQPRSSFVVWLVTLFWWVKLLGSIPARCCLTLAFRNWRVKKSFLFFFLHSVLEEQHPKSTAKTHIWFTLPMILFSSLHSNKLLLTNSHSWWATVWLQNQWGQGRLGERKRKKGNLK